MNAPRTASASRLRAVGIPSSAGTMMNGVGDGAPSSTQRPTSTGVTVIRTRGNRMKPTAAAGGAGTAVSATASTPARVGTPVRSRVFSRTASTSQTSLRPAVSTEQRRGSHTGLPRDTNTAVKSLSTVTRSASSKRSHSQPHRSVPTAASRQSSPHVRQRNASPRAPPRAATLITSSKTATLSPSTSISSLSSSVGTKRAGTRVRRARGTATPVMNTTQAPLEAYKGCVTSSLYLRQLSETVGLASSPPRKTGVHQSGGGGSVRRAAEFSSVAKMRTGRTARRAPPLVDSSDCVAPRGTALLQLPRDCEDTLDSPSASVCGSLNKGKDALLEVDRCTHPTSPQSRDRPRNVTSSGAQHSSPRSPPSKQQVLPEETHCRPTGPVATEQWARSVVHSGESPSNARRSLSRFTRRSVSSVSHLTATPLSVTPRVDERPRHGSTRLRPVPGNSGQKSRSVTPRAGLHASLHVPDARTALLSSRANGCEDDCALTPFHSLHDTSREDVASPASHLSAGAPSPEQTTVRRMRHGYLQEGVTPYSTSSSTRHSMGRAAGEKAAVSEADAYTPVSHSSAASTAAIDRSPQAIVPKANVAPRETTAPAMGAKTNGGRYITEVFPKGFPATSATPVENIRPCPNAIPRNSLGRESTRGVSLPVRHVVTGARPYGKRDRDILVSSLLRNDLLRSQHPALSIQRLTGSRTRRRPHIAVPPHTMQTTTVHLASLQEVDAGEGEKLSSARPSFRLSLTPHSAEEEAAAAAASQLFFASREGRSKWPAAGSLATDPTFVLTSEENLARLLLVDEEWTRRKEIQKGRSSVPTGAVTSSSVSSDHSRNSVIRSSHHPRAVPPLQAGMMQAAVSLLAHPASPMDSATPVPREVTPVPFPCNGYSHNRVPLPHPSHPNSHRSDSKVDLSSTSSHQSASSHSGRDSPSMHRTMDAVMPSTMRAAPGSSSANGLSLSRGRSPVTSPSARDSVKRSTDALPTGPTVPWWNMDCKYASELRDYAIFFQDDRRQLPQMPAVPTEAEVYAKALEVGRIAKADLRLDKGPLKPIRAASPDEEEDALIDEVRLLDDDIYHQRHVQYVLTLFGEVWKQPNTFGAGQAESLKNQTERRQRLSGQRAPFASDPMVRALCVEKLFHKAEDV